MNLVLKRSVNTFGKCVSLALSFKEQVLVSGMMSIFFSHFFNIAIPKRVRIYLVGIVTICNVSERRLMQHDHTEKQSNPFRLNQRELLLLWSLTIHIFVF